MVYADFSLKSAVRELNFSLQEARGIFAEIPEVAINPYLQETLPDHVALAMAINTEKARSELIISHILVELRQQFSCQVSFFSGSEFNVDPAQSLTGYCDFLISLSPEQLFIVAPVVAIVEAKNENLFSGLGQCAAEMIAARLFNNTEGNAIDKIYGAVTSGNFWRFLRLENSVLAIDLQDYSIENPGKILGILSAMLRQTA